MLLKSRGIISRLLGIGRAYHIPVMREECCNYLQITAGGVYVDCTVGGGGHTHEILSRGGKVIGLDQDMDAISETTRRLSNYVSEGSLELHHTNFQNIVPVVQSSSLRARCSSSGLVDGVLLDLGVSSFQIDNPSRGFAFRLEDCPLDMRMNTSTHNNITAAHLLNSLDTEELADIFYVYGDVSSSRMIAREIVASRPVTESSDVVKIIARLVPDKYLTKTLARCFQALRIVVNKEMESLEKVLSEVHHIVRPSGRLVVLSYHSHEDRQVKDLFRRRVVADRDTSVGSCEVSLEWNRNDEIDSIDNDIVPLSIRKRDTAVNCVWKAVTKKPISPTRSEISRNSRARSAKLRVGERTVKTDIGGTITM